MLETTILAFAVCLRSMQRQSYDFRAHAVALPIGAVHLTIAAAQIPPANQSPNAMHVTSIRVGSPRLPGFSVADFDNAERAADIGLIEPITSSETTAGREAPTFSLPTLNGTEVSLDAMQGKVVLLNFWASWCGPCRAEMSSLEQLYRDFSAYRDFALLTVNTEKHGARSVERFMAKHGYDFPVLLDAGNAASAAYGVSALPSTFVIDRDGRIVWKHSGALDWSDSTLRYGLKRLLKKKSPEKKQPRSIGTIEARFER